MSFSLSLLSRRPCLENCTHPHDCGRAQYPNPVYSRRQFQLQQTISADAEDIHIISTRQAKACHPKPTKIATESVSMNPEIQSQAVTAKAEIENLTVLQEPAGALVAEPQADARAVELANAINLSDTNSVISFGSGAQSELQTISQAMLAGVKNKDLGPAGDSLRTMVTTIRGFTVEKGDTRNKKTWFEKLLGRATPFVNFTAKFEGVQSQIDKITDNLLSHEHTLMRDIKALDRLYEKTLDFYNDLGAYIAAGQFKIDEVDSVDIPVAEAKVANAEDSDQVQFAQELRDLRSARDDLERRVHDLRLTRQVTMQSLPSIRLVQENDKSLVNKINSTLVNTVPLWETQMAQAVTIQRSAQAAEAVRTANDLTNELLTANAANLRDANATIRKEIERGVFDIEAVKQANADLIGTIEESLMIADEGKAKRVAAEQELQTMEAELRNTLARSKATTVAK